MGVPWTPASNKHEPIAVPRGGWALFAILLAGLGVLFVRANHVHVVKFEGYPLVVADPKQLDFGERTEGDEFKWTFTILNRSHSAIRINRFWTSCDCTTVEPDQITIGPGKRAELTATIKPRAQSNEAVSQQIVVLKGLNGDTSQPVFVAQMRGRVKQLFDLDPSSPTFVDPVVRGIESPTLHIKATPTVEKGSVRVEADSEISARVSRSDTGYDIFLRLKPKQSGPWSGSFHLVVENRAGVVVGKQVVAIAADVIDRVHAEPSTFNFGVMAVGSVVERSISFKSAARESFTIDSSTADAGVQIVPRGDGLTYLLRLPISRGDFSTEAIFIARMSDGELIRLPVRLRVYGSD